MIISPTAIPLGLGSAQGTNLTEQFDKASNLNSSPAATGKGFAQMIKDHLDQTSEAQHTAKENNFRLQMGDPNMTLEKSVISSTEASLQFSSLLSTRNKLMEAYRDVINMPV